MIIEQRVYKLLTKLIEDSGSNIKVDSNLEINRIPRMDSIFFLEMITDLEKEFKIKFDLEDLIGEKKVGDFIVIIKRLLENGL